VADDIIGFIGIGNMGWPMAANLVRKGYKVLAWDTVAEQRRRFAREFDSREVQSTAELSEASVIITMLPTGPIVRDALMATSQGSLESKLRPGTIVIDMSSSEPVGTQELGAALGSRGIILIDAPVSGGVARAIDGSLAIMIGSDHPETIEQVRPVLSTLGKRLFLTGKLGSGHAMKALNNLISATTFTVASEALIIGERFGLDPATMVDIINVSTGRSFATEIPIKEHVLTKAFATGFSVGLMTKDVKIAAGLADAIGIEAPVGHLVHDLLAQARDDLGPNADHTAAYTAWEKRRIVDG
jgi:3-hydroxyisobutyrate dehydrogenase